MSLSIILSAMCGGKSTALLRELSSDAAIGLNTLYINHTLDTRATTIYSTHNPIISSNITNEIRGIKFEKTEKLSEINVESFDVIAIDEAQFYSDLFECVKLWVEKLQKKVLVAGLDGDSNRNKFGQILDLIPLCDSVVKLNPYCKLCAAKNPRQLKFAPFTFRKDITNSNMVFIGGTETYSPVCRQCYLQVTSSTIQ